jgi:putative endonuclease
VSNDPRRGVGSAGEQLAAEHLSRAGYAILERNFRCRAGELDIVAAGRGCLVFCEVKTRLAGGRRGPAGPLDAIGSRKRGRLRRLAAEWMSARGGDRPRPRSIRFDAIGITLDRQGRLVALEHIENAF